MAIFNAGGGSLAFTATATLDSLGVVNLIATTQEKIEDAFGVRLTLADGEFLTAAAQQAATLGGFIDHIEATLDKRGHV